MGPLENVKEVLNNIAAENIVFKDHFFDKIKERGISEELVRSFLKKTDKLLSVEEQPSRKEGESKYKLWIKLSQRYSLVVIIAIAKKDLYIITAWKTDRRWQKSIQK